ncbi:MAG: 50S ribosomal protein L6 [Candidatus Pacearchaeota archaeon]
MKKEIFNEVEIPEGIEVKISGNDVIMSKGENKLEKHFNFNLLSVEHKDGRVIVGHKKATKIHKRMINTIAAHLRNMIKGLEEGFEYDLKIASSHFPMNVDLQGDKAIIKNFLGEKIPRNVKVPEGAEVEINGDMIKIKSANKEIAGQAAANFEQATRIKAKDKRIFQDGIFIVNKAGKEI